MNERVKKCVETIRRVTDFEPKVALVLGSGLGNYANQVHIIAEINYAEIPDFPVSTAPGHAGRFLFGYVADVPVVVMQGRVHLYEGYTPEEVVLPIRVMKALGAEILFVTNASGALHMKTKPGTLCVITDQISSFVPNPLIGPNDDEEGPRFPVMEDAYDPELQRLIKLTAMVENIPLHEGTYCQLSGPSFETPAEIKMLRAIGADMVGMSTAIEVLAARHMGMRVCGISFISNMAAGLADHPTTDEEIRSRVLIAEPTFTRLVTRTISAMKDILASMSAENDRRVAESEKSEL